MPINYGDITALYTKLTYPVGGGVSSGSVTAKTGPGAFVGIMVTAVGNTPLLTVYDNTASSGTTIMDEFIPVVSILYSFARPIAFYTGLRVKSGGSVGCTIVYY